MKQIILNADIGEEAGFDDQIMPYISWCNIACASHAGSEKTIKETIDMALEHNVKIGAHPSYPDRENFGRMTMKMSSKNLAESISDQIQLVKYYVEKTGAELHHVKPHGALYNDAAINHDVAEVIKEVVQNIDKSLYIITSKNDQFSYLFEDELLIKYEAFADRSYHKDLTLVSRLIDGAVIKDLDAVFEHVSNMIFNNKVNTVDGGEVSIFFDTICVHGDNPKSVAILENIYNRFSAFGYVFKDMV